MAKTSLTVSWSELTDISRKSIKIADSRLDLSDGKTEKCCDSIKQILWDASSQKNINVRDIQSVICTPIDLLVKTLERTSPSQAIVIHHIWQEIQGILEEQIKNNTAPNIHTVNNLKAWVQQYNYTAYLNFFDEISTQYYQDEPISHTTVIALHDLIDNFETQFANTLAAWFERNITQDFGKEDLLDLINESISEFEYYSDFLPHGTQHIFREKIGEFMMERLETRTNIPDNRAQIRYMFNDINENQENWKINYDVISESLLTEKLLEETITHTEDEITTMYDIVEDLKYSNITKENAVSESIRRFSKQAYAWRKELIDIDILKAIIEEIYTVVIPQKNSIQEKNSWSLNTEEKRQLKYTRRSIERIWHRLEEIWNNMLLLEDDILDSQHTEYFSIITDEILEKESLITQFFETYTTLDNLDDVQLAFTDYLQICGYGSIHEIAQTQAWNSTPLIELLQKTQTPSRKALWIKSRITASLKTKKRIKNAKKSLDILPFSQKHLYDISTWIEDLSEIQTIGIVRLQKNYQETINSIKKYDFLMNEHKENYENIKSWEETISQYVTKKESLLDSLSTLQEKVAPLQVRIEEQKNKEKEVQNFIRTAIFKIGKDVQSEDEMTFIRQYNQLADSNIDNMLKLKSLLESDFIKSIISSLSQSQSFWKELNMDFLENKDDDEAAVAKKIEDILSLNIEDLESFLSEMKYIIKDTENLVWRKLVFHQVLDITPKNTPDRMKEISKNFFPTGLRSVIRWQERKIKKRFN